MGQLILLRRQSVLEIAQTASSSVRSDMHWDLLRQATEAKLRSETVTTLRKQLSELSEQAVARLGSGFFFSNHAAVPRDAFVLATRQRLSFAAVLQLCGNALVLWQCISSGNALGPW